VAAPSYIILGLVCVRLYNVHATNGLFSTKKEDGEGPLWKVVFIFSTANLKNQEIIHCRKIAKNHGLGCILLNDRFLNCQRILNL